jgi:hypothetical protein
LHVGFGSGGADLKQGSKTSVYLSTSNKVDKVSGRYFSNSRETSSAGVSYDQNLQDMLWKESERMTGFTYDLSQV